MKKGRKFKRKEDFQLNFDELRSLFYLYKDAKSKVNKKTIFSKLCLGLSELGEKENIEKKYALLKNLKRLGLIIELKKIADEPSYEYEYTDYFEDIDIPPEIVDVNNYAMAKCKIKTKTVISYIQKKIKKKLSLCEKVIENYTELIEIINSYVNSKKGKNDKLNYQYTELLHKIKTFLSDTKNKEELSLFFESTSLFGINLPTYMPPDNLYDIATQIKTSEQLNTFTTQLCSEREKIKKIINLATKDTYKKPSYPKSFFLTRIGASLFINKKYIIGKPNSSGKNSSFVDYIEKNQNKIISKKELSFLEEKPIKKVLNELGFVRELLPCFFPIRNSTEIKARLSVKTSKLEKEGINIEELMKTLSSQHAKKTQK